MCAVWYKAIHNVISAVFYHQKHCGTLIPLGPAERKRVVFKGIDFWGVSGVSGGGGFDRTGSVCIYIYIYRRVMRRRIDWIWSAPFFPFLSYIYIFFCFFPAHTIVSFSARENPGNSDNT